MHRRKSLTGTLRRLLAASNGSVLASGGVGLHKLTHSGQVSTDQWSIFVMGAGSPAHRALSTCSAAIPANSDQGPSGWESWHAAGVLLGVSALAAASCTRAECESQQVQSQVPCCETQEYQEEYSTELVPVLQSAPSAQARLAELWADISEDLHRTEAGFPLAPQLAQR